MTGEREEHVVEGRPTQGDVVDPDAELVEVADDLDEPAGPAVYRRGEATSVLVDADLAIGSRRRVSTPRAISEPSRTTTSMRSPPTCDLSSSAVPRAMIFP